MRLTFSCGKVYLKVSIRLYTPILQTATLCRVLDRTDSISTYKLTITQIVVYVTAVEQRWEKELFDGIFSTLNFIDCGKLHFCVMYTNVVCYFLLPILKIVCFYARQYTVDSENKNLIKTQFNDRICSIYRNKSSLHREKKKIVFYFPILLFLPPLNFKFFFFQRRSTTSYQNRIDEICNLNLNKKKKIGNINEDSKI